MDDASKTRGIKQSNFETWLLFAPLSKFLATCLDETTNYNFVLPSKTCHRHFERAASVWDLVQNNQSPFQLYLVFAQFFTVNAHHISTGQAFSFTTMPGWSSMFNRKVICRKPKQRAAISVCVVNTYTIKLAHFT